MRARVQGVADHRAGFTLVELLVVVLIVALVSAVALSVILPALNSRQTREAGRLLQGALVGARDQAIHDGQPSGIRLLADPALPGAYNRVIPIGTAPEYSEGLVTTRPGIAYPTGITGAGFSPLVLEQAPVDGQGLPTSPTSWAWNIRVGDQLQLSGTGPWYTVMGPAQVAPTTPNGGNTEWFVNWGPPGTASNLTNAQGVPVEYLLLVNGLDDNANGWVDEGWDGVDNDGINGTDDVNEREPERWIGAAGRPAGVVAVPYVIRRRALPATNARELALPSRVVIDAARSALPVNPADGSVDILLQPDGSAAPSMPYGLPASLSMAAAWFHFALVDRTDVGTNVPPESSWAVLSLDARTGRIVVAEDPDPAAPFAYALRGGQ